MTLLESVEEKDLMPTYAEPRIMGREPLVVAAGFSHCGELSPGAHVALGAARRAILAVFASVAVPTARGPKLTGNACSICSALLSSSLWAHAWL